MKEKQSVPYIVPKAPLDKGIIAADPLGSYTGVPVDPEDVPVQDADDL